MPEDPKAEPEVPEAPDAKPEEENEAGDFITRNVLEKDTVFFEG